MASSNIALQFLHWRLLASASTGWVWLEQWRNVWSKYIYFVAFLWVAVKVLSKFDQTLTVTNYQSCIKVWSNFALRLSKFDQSLISCQNLIKLWWSHVKRLSKFDAEVQSFIKLSWFISNFDTSIKVWSNFDMVNQSFVKFWNWASNFDKTLAWDLQSLIKVWHRKSNFDQTLTVLNQSLIKLWWSFDSLWSNFDITLTATPRKTTK